MHNFGFVFAGSDVTKIRRSQIVDDFNLHISVSDLPPQINTIHTTQDAFMSFVENNGNKYLVVLNNLWDKAQEVQIELNDMVYMIDHDGKFTELQPGLYELPLEGGDMRIFKYE